MKKLKRPFTILVVFLFSLSIFASFIGLWAHNFAPVHLYDPSITGTTIGEHNPNFFRIKSFLGNYVAYQGVDQIVADDSNLLYVLLPSLEYGKIRNARTPEWMVGPRKNTLFVELRHLHLYQYFEEPALAYYAPQTVRAIGALMEKESQLRYMLQMNSSRIYDDGQFVVWRLSCP